MTMEIYIPPNSITLDKLDIPQIRLGIQGDGGTGKTWAALTFPNCVAMDLDRGLGAHRGRLDVISLPFWDGAWLSVNFPRDPTNTREAVVSWIEKEGKKLAPNQTLVIDGNTGFQRAFHSYEEKHPTLSKSGKYDDFAEWANKIKFYGRFFDALKSLRCHVVFILHEQADRGKDGDLNGKLKPLLSGQVGDQIKNEFTDWVRQHCGNKPTDYSNKNVLDKIAQFNLTPEEFKTSVNKLPRQTFYYWQLESDDVCNCKVSSLVNFPRFIFANYETFVSYLRK